MEVWKTIENYPFYQISNCGRVKSLRFGKEKIMKQNRDTRGYNMIHLRNEVSDNYLLVHRLVALNFIPNPDNKPCVNHKDGNKLNNSDWNLEWNTQQENVIHAHINGLCSDKSGHNNGRALLSVNQVIEIRNSNKRPIRLLAVEYGVSSSCVESIIKRKTWNHI